MFIFIDVNQWRNVYFYKAAKIVSAVFAGHSEVST